MKGRELIFWILAIYIHIINPLWPVSGGPKDPYLCKSLIALKWVYESDWNVCWPQENNHLKFTIFLGVGGGGPRFWPLEVQCLKMSDPAMPKEPSLIKELVSTRNKINFKSQFIIDHGVEFYNFILIWPWSKNYN